MAGEWEDLTLGDLGRVVTGKTPLTAVEGNFGGQIPFVTPSDMDGRKSISTTARFLTQAGAASVKGSVIPAGAIMVSCIGSDMGKVVIAGRECVTNQQINSIVVDDRFSSEFVYYSLSTRKNEIRHQAAGGSAVPILNKGDFSCLEITLPPLAEQKAIAAVLGSLDDKIELNRRMNTTLEAMARALFQSWFVDFDPIRAKLDGRKPIGLDKATAELFPEHLEDSPLGHIPKGWKIIGLPEAIDFLEGPGLRNWQYHDEGMKFLNIRCIMDGDLDIVKANSISLEEFEKTYSHFALQEDDIVISTSGTLGRLAIVRADHLPVMLNTSIIRMRGRGAVGLGYVWGFLQSEYFLAEMFALAAGSVQLNFGPMHLRQISILRPPDGILKGFERAVQPLLSKCLQLRKESRTLATLRDTLLPKLLSGEVSVAEVEKEVSA
jgi:type I restriction enzyme S subunit